MLLTSSLLSTIEGVVHGFTTREGGVSLGSLATLNLAWDRGEPARNEENWRRVKERLGSSESAVAVVHQVHGDRIVEAEGGGSPLRPQQDADAIYTMEPGIFLAVRTADCVPILLAGPGGVAAVHAGWRGTALGISAKAAGILSRQLGCKPTAIKAAIGPSIGVGAYEVGSEVVEGIGKRVPEHIFVRRKGDSVHVDLKAANRFQLRDAGVQFIDVLSECTHENPLFFSHRRDGGATGRMASVIGWFPPC